MALEHGDQARAIRSLQLLGPSDGDYVEATNLLVDVLQKEGHLDMAQEKIEQVIHSQGAESVPLETCDRLARFYLEVDDRNMRSAERALAFADEATTLQPTEARYWRTVVTFRVRWSATSSGVMGFGVWPSGPACLCSLIAELLFWLVLSVGECWSMSIRGYPPTYQTGS